MKIQSKAQFLNFFGTISLSGNDKLNKSQKMKEWEQQSVNKAISKISEYPTFTEIPVIQVQDNTQQVREFFQDISKKTKEKYQTKADKYGITYDQENINWLELFGDVERYERLLEVQAQADKYNIPYNKKNIDWVKLTDDVEKWERLLEQAQEYNLKVDSNDYDPWAVEDLIAEEISQNRQEMRDLRANYRATILCQ